MEVKKTKKEFLKFVIVGCANTLIGIILSAIWAIIMDEVVAFLFGFYISLIISYFLNSKFVFGEKYSFNKMIKFQISYIPNFLIQLITIYVLVENLEIIPIIIYALSALISVPITFIMLKLIAFKGSGGKK